VAEAGAVENDDPVIFCSEINQTAGFEILDHAAVAMKKNQRVAFAAFDVMKPNPVYLKEATGGRIVMLRFLREMTIDQGDRGQRSDRNR
jgi:hypothetical protein